MHLQPIQVQLSGKIIGHRTVLLYGDWFTIRTSDTMGIEEVKEVMNREKEKRLNISRIPKRIRENFIGLANEEFSEDYGMCLKYLWDIYEQYTYFMNNFDIKLDYLISLQKENQSHTPEMGRRMINGKVLNGGENK